MEKWTCEICNFSTESADEKLKHKTDPSVHTDAQLNAATDRIYEALKVIVNQYRPADLTFDTIERRASMIRMAFGISRTTCLGGALQAAISATYTGQNKEAFLAMISEIYDLFNSIEGVRDHAEAYAESNARVKLLQMESVLFTAPQSDLKH